MRPQNLFSITFLAALLLAILCAPPGLAQSQPDPVFHVLHIRVKPEAMREFERLLKAEVLPAFKKSGGTSLQAWATTNFGEAFEYYFVRQVNGIRDFDEPHYLIKALGEKGAEELRQKIRRLCVSQHQFMLTRKAALSWLPNASYQPKVAVLTRAIVANGRTEEYEKYVKENTTPVVAKTNVKGYRISRVGLGGNASEYFSLLMCDSYAEIEGYPARMRKARTEAGLSTTPAGLLTRSVSTVLRYLPELSVTPAPQQAAK
jgi:hypothetical protein